MTAGRAARATHGDWDVAIVGAGPAASAAALCLLQAPGLRVCIIDPGHRQPFAVGESIPPDTRLDLERLGAWDRFVADAHQPCLGSCSAWGSDQLGYNDFLLNPYGAGWHLDRPRFNRTLLEQACSAGATTITGSRLTGRPEKLSAGYRLRLLDHDSAADRPLTTRFVIDATGRSAAFARTTGAERTERDRLCVVCGFFDGVTAASPSRLTLLEAERDGWWYAAALPDNRLIVAFSTDASTVRQAGLTRPGRWLARCLGTHHVAGRLDGCRFLPDSLTVRLATSSILRPSAGPHWFAVGDAAATHDPISSAGIQKALADGARAATAAATALSDTGTGTVTDIAVDYITGTETAFREYEANRDYFYRLEERWPDSPFWHRRAAIPQPCRRR
jgi:flavin-dependent dehydrogenase